MANITDEQTANLREAEERVGTALNAKWTLVELLGSGGMGAVYAAVHRNGSRAAVKVLHQRVASDLDLRGRFLREGKIANTVDHEARVRVIDDDVSDRGEPFLVMDLLEGESLEQRMRDKGGKLSPIDVLPVFDVVLELLARCHDVQIIHRDLKPANVFLTRRGEVKVLDFGIARMREGQTPETRAGVALGTPAFMAPEQAMGYVAVDGRADIFSVGACMYTALSGARLNQGRSEVESYLLAAMQPAPSIARVLPQLTPELAAFIDKALAFDRGRRFPDARSMRSELCALIAALRAGQLGPAPAKPSGGVVVRGNDLVTDDSAAAGEAKAQSHEKMLGIMKYLGHAIAGARQYGWSHSQTTKSLADLLGALALGTFSVQWDVTSTAFCYGGKPIWQPDRPPLDRVPYQLFADGVRKIELKSGITEQELRDFIAILLRDLSSGVTEEDDSVTALWDRRLEHVAYVAIDSFAEGDERARDAFDHSCAEVAQRVKRVSRIDKDWSDGSPEARALEIRMTAQLRETGASASALALDGITRATLGAQMTQGEERWSERFVDAFVIGYLEAMRSGGVELLNQALQEWTGDQVMLKNYILVFRMFQLLRDACAAELAADQAGDIERRICETMFPSATLRTILAEFVTDERRAERAQSAVVEGGIGPGLAAALAILDDDSVYGVACNCFDVFGGEPLGQVLLDYLKRWAKGHEQELGAILARTSVAAGVEIVRVLSELGTPAAVHAMEEGFKSPHVPIRLQGVGSFLQSSSPGAKRELDRLLADADPAVRLEVLGLIGTMKLRPAGPHVVSRIRDSGFHRLDLGERRRWIETIAQLDWNRAEAVLVELLATRPLIPSEAVEQTRAFAADYLASATTPSALEALKDAAKMRWWNTPTVRKAANRALAAIEARAAAPGPSDPPTGSR